MTKKNEKKEKDVLDQVKAFEKRKKALLLAKNLSEIKELAKSVRVMKEKCNIILEEVGINKKDIKRIIDFVNELEETKLSDRDKDEIREQIRKSLKRNKKDIEKKIVEDGGSFMRVSTNFTDSTTLSSGNNTLELKL